MENRFVFLFDIVIVPYLQPRVYIFLKKSGNVPQGTAFLYFFPQTGDFSRFTHGFRLTFRRIGSIM